MIDVLKPLIQQFMPFAQQKMGFSRPPKLFLRQDAQNAANPMGKTGFYDPQNEAVTLYITGRHPKDIMRSLAHELMHHTQNCNGEFEKVTTMGEEGYAQNDPHMRNMEIQAYQASIVFRDWEDSTKGTIYYEHLQKGDKSSMSTKDWKNGELKSLLSEAWGFKMDLSKLNEEAKPDYIDLDKDGDKEESMKKAAKDRDAGRTGSGVDHGGDDDEEAKKETEGKADSKRELEEYASKRDGESKGDDSDTHKGEKDYTTKKGEKLKHSGKGRGEKKGDEAYINEDDMSADSHKSAAKRDYPEPSLEEDGAKRKGDPRLRRPDPDRLRESVAKLHKAGFSETQIKEFLGNAFSKALKG